MTDTEQRWMMQAERVVAAITLTFVPLMFMLRMKWFTNMLMDWHNLQAYNLFLYAAAMGEYNHKCKFQWRLFQNREIYLDKQRTAIKDVLFGGIIGECIILSTFNCYNQLK